MKVSALNGTIGAPGVGNDVLIESTASIERIQAREIFATIIAAVDGEQMPVNCAVANAAIDGDDIQALIFTVDLWSAEHA